MNQATIVHIIPVDDELDVNIGSVSKTRLEQNENMDVIDEEINNILQNRLLLRVSASALLKREANSIGNRLKDYQRRVRRRNMHSILRKLRVTEQPKITARTNTDYSIQLHVAKIEYVSPCEHSIASDSTFEMTDSFSVDQDYALLDLQERESIWNQAKRMKRMTTLVRSIEKTQQHLIDDLLECRRVALEDTHKL